MKNYYTLKKSSDGQFYFVLKAGNNEIHSLRVRDIGIEMEQLMESSPFKRILKFCPDLKIELVMENSLTISF